MNWRDIAPVALAGLAVAAPVTHAQATPAQAGAPTAREPAPAPSRAKAPVERLSVWPKPTDKDTLLVDIERLCKARTPEMGTQAHDALIACGASAVPFLLDRYGHERDPDAVKRVRDVLMETTDATQTRLLAKEFESKSSLERTFALWRSASFPDPELAKPATAALERVKKQGAKADPEERYAAALCAASAGSNAGMDLLWDVALNEWDKRGVELRTAVESLRGPEAARWAIEKSKDGARKEKLATLRLLAGLGDRASTSYVRPFLDDSDNTLRVAAVNALRGIVDGDLPLEQLPVFEVIDVAKKWKTRL